MKLLVVATKPPWPPIDGGRVLLKNSLEALATEGVEIDLVAPVEEEEKKKPQVGKKRQEIEETLRAFCRPHLVPVLGGRRSLGLVRAVGVPTTIARHSLGAVRWKVGELLAGARFDVVHAEQLQALPQAIVARRFGVPIVLRAQNVESDLWLGWAARSGGATRLLLALEARRLARWEGRAVAQVDETWALSAEDAARLGRLAGGRGNLAVIPPPFPSPAQSTEPLPGSPAVVVMGSGGWRPNADALRWFLHEAWGEILRAEPAAQLHVFGPAEGACSPTQLFFHPAPIESASAFAAGSIHVVPLRVGSGVRIKILEAWARGIPVVGTPQAFSGLNVGQDEAGRIAETAGDFARAISDLARDPGLARSLVDGGRRILAERHAPEAIGRAMLVRYEALARLRNRR
jgi:glycosyltransferase involved in cell wall biosynthesis